MAEKIEAGEIAATLARLVTADLASTLAILSGMLQTIRENDDRAVDSARFAADSLRIELDKWRKRKSDDETLKALREAGAAAAKK